MTIQIESTRTTCFLLYSMFLLYKNIEIRLVEGLTIRTSVVCACICTATKTPSEDRGTSRGTRHSTIKTYGN